MDCFNSLENETFAKLQTKGRSIQKDAYTGWETAFVIILITIIMVTSTHPIVNLLRPIIIVSEFLKAPAQENKGRNEETSN